MAAPPPADQNAYYNPANPAQPTYYVAPQPIPGTPAQQYQPQPIQGTPAQQFQPVGTPAQQFQPVGTPLQQYQQPVGTPVQQFQPQPDPMLAQHYSPQTSPQQPYYAPQQVPGTSPGAAPATVVYTTTTTEAPQTHIVQGDGKGIVGKMPQLENCCFCFPLHTGAMIIAAVMLIYYGYCGLVLVLASGYTGGYFIVLIILGIFYLLIALVSGYGFAGIYKEEPMWVDRFIRMFLICSIVWLLLYIAKIILVAVYWGQYSGYYYVGVPWAAYIIELIISAAFQYYFCVCLVSYQRVLHARINSNKLEMN